MSPVTLFGTRSKKGLVKGHSGRGDSRRLVETARLSLAIIFHETCEREISMRRFEAQGEGEQTYFLKARATPLPQEPLVLQASSDALERVSADGVCREMYG